MSVKPRRTSEKGAITKKINALDIENAEDSALQASLKYLSDKRTLLNDLHKKILVEISNTGGDDLSKNMDKEILEHDTFDETILRKIFSIENRLKGVSKSMNETLNNSSDKGESNVKSERSIKLPKISLKKFSGNELDFVTFLEQFEAAVHKNNELSRIEKFTYLKSLLEEKPLMSIKGLPLTSENYEVALDILKSRYGNKQVIISKHMDHLIKLPNISHSSNTKELRNLYDKIEINIKSLNSLGIDSDNYGPLLVPIILSRVPDDIQLIISRNCNKRGEVWNIKHILDILKQEVMARENCCFSGQNKDKAVSAQTLNIKETPVSCIFCNKGHKSQNCKFISEHSHRMQYMYENRFCYICLKKNHLAKNCRSRIQCSICHKRHNDAIHFAYEKGNFPVKNTGKITGDGTANQPSNSLTCHVYTRKKSLLQTAQAKISPIDRKKSQNVRLILDNGSNRSYISERVRKILNLPGIAKENLSISVFGQTQCTPTTCDIVQLIVRNRKGQNPVSISATVVPHITRSLEPYTEASWFENNFELFGNLDLADSKIDNTLELGSDIDILIGSDFYWAFVSDKVIRSANGTVALESKLGWIFSGPVLDIPDSESSSHLVNSQGMDKINQFWELENLGIPKEEPSFFDEFSEKIIKESKRYSVPLPFKQVESKLISNNRHMAATRLKSLHEKLNKDKELKEAYSKIFENQLNEGIIEEVTKEPTTLEQSYYMPHHGIQRLDKNTTRLRVVFDASSKSKGKSLNEIVHAGPNLLSPLFDILIKFRTHKIVLLADIKQAFLQIGIQEKHRDFLRFLWFRNPDEKIPEVREFRYTRAVFGVKCSPFLLNATIKSHLQKYNSSIARKIYENLYVDDLSTGEKTVEEAFELYKKSKTMLKEGGFDLRKWDSNSKELLEKINDEEHVLENNIVSRGVLEDVNTYADSVTRTLDVQNNEAKVLGILWDKDKDEFVFKLGETKLEAKKKYTKRNILGKIASIYDPIGFLSPIIVKLKILFKNICNAKGGWDDVIDDSSKKMWNEWVENADKLEFRVKRCFIPASISSIIKVQYHTFFDASIAAYAAVTYLRVSYLGGVSISIIASKSRITPQRKITIPRLELLGGLLGANLWNNVNKILTGFENLDHESYFWGDAKVALFWINNGDEDRYKEFVRNRVIKIRSITSSIPWNHVPGEENPADLPTRGINPSELIDNMFWLNGPAWLEKDQAEWPLQHDNDVPDPQEEIKTKCKEKTLNIATDVNLGIDELIDETKYSSIRKLYRVTSYVKRFIHNIRNKENPTTGELTYEEVSNSEIEWIKILQKRLVNIKNYEKLESQLRIYRDNEGFLRTKGRIDNAEFPSEVIKPMVLPKNEHLSRLYVMDAHSMVFHNGVNDTMAYIRKKFWIPALRQLTRQIVYKCRVCKKLEGKPFKSRPIPPLPDFRVRPSQPFSECCIDFAGPVYIRKTENKRSPSVKAYIALITCASSRALHLEVTTDLSADALVLCLRRFISKRSCPSYILSDNFKSFKSEKVKEFLRDRGISWDFNVPKAPWTRGIVERLVRSTKRCLKKKLGRARLSYEELDTICSEIATTINNRPLTYIDNDSIQDAVSPNHLSFGKRVELVNSKLPEKIPDLTEENLSRRILYRCSLVHHFLRRWKEEYLLALREKYLESNKSGVSIEIGDVVIVKDDGPRIMWRLAKVVALKSSRDGEIRSATLRMADRDRKTTELCRPIEDLYPLELKCDTSQTTIPASVSEEIDKFDTDDGASACESNSDSESETSY